MTSASKIKPPATPLLIVLGVLSVCFLLLLASFFLPPFRKIFSGFPFTGNLLAILASSILLLRLLSRQSTYPKLTKSLKLTGRAGLGFFANVLLHNFAYALAIVFQEIFLVKTFFNILNVLAFFLAVLICPFGFAIGLLASLFFLFKKK